MATQGMVIRLDRSDDAWLLTLAHPASFDPQSYARYRPAAFDDKQHRYDFEPQGSGASGDVGLSAFKLAGEAPLDRIKYIGIERLTAAGVKLIAEKMSKVARDAGLEPLPFPVDGQPYDFSLTSIDGRRLRAEDLRGKVTLIDCWATWCGPCMAKMPQLKKHYAEWRPRGFEIIGVNFDNSTEAATKAIESNELPWPQVLVPTDADKRNLWNQASGITSLPKLLLVHRDGVLRIVSSPGALDEQVEELLGKPEPHDR
jgi:thiol-disulfide isomerase/thioredoxin